MFRHLVDMTFHNYSVGICGHGAIESIQKNVCMLLHLGIGI
jgi:hypothetical protein